MNARLSRRIARISSATLLLALLTACYPEHSPTAPSFRATPEIALVDGPGSHPQAIGKGNGGPLELTH
jgi:hypothetical protein